MLSTLPQEIVLIIARHLEFRDKLSLVLTCQGLNKVLLNTLLYQELNFYHGRKALRSALRYFESRPILGSQVRRLHFREADFTEQQLIRIAIAFPKVSEFTSTYKSNHKEMPHLNPLFRWKDTLEKCHTCCKSYELMSLLKDNTFSCLTSLSIKTDRPFRIHDAEINWNALDCLENAPLLNDLRLGGENISFEALEKLHRVCPQLQSLGLYYLHFVTPSNDTLPPSISPATSLLSLTMGADTQIEGASCTILDYIIVKYTQLVQLEVMSAWDHIAHRDVDDSDDDIDDDFDDLNDAFPSSVGNNNPGIDNDVYYRRGNDFLSNLPATIKTLKINPSLFKDPIASLEKTAINPKELTFLAYNYRGGYPAEVIKKQNHIDYIKRLDQLKTLTIGFQYNMRNHIDTMAFGNITHLTAMILDTDLICEFNIDQLFLMFPSLISLTMHEGYHPLTASSDSTEVTYPNVRKLAIKRCNLDQRVLDFVRTALPNIKELELPIYKQKHVNRHMWCFDQDSECDCKLDHFFGSRKIRCHFNSEFCINLSGCKLDVFNLTMRWVDLPFYLELYTQKKCTKYTLKRNSDRRYYLDSTRPDEIIQGSNVVKITCDSIKRFMIRSEDVKLSLFDV